MLSMKQAARRPETAVAQRSVGLRRAQAVGIDAEVAERGPRDVGQAEIAEHIGEQAADEELERQVVDALVTFGVARAFGREPAMNDPVADGMRGRDEPVAIGGRGGILSNRQRQLREDGALEFGKVFLTWRTWRWRFLRCFGEFASETRFCHELDLSILALPSPRLAAGEGDPCGRLLVAAIVQDVCRGAVDDNVPSLVLSIVGRIG